MNIKIKRNFYHEVTYVIECDFDTLTLDIYNLKVQGYTNLEELEIMNPNIYQTFSIDINFLLLTLNTLTGHYHGSFVKDEFSDICKGALEIPSRYQLKVNLENLDPVTSLSIAEFLFPSNSEIWINDQKIEYLHFKNINEIKDLEDDFQGSQKSIHFANNRFNKIQENLNKLIGGL